MWSWTAAAAIMCIVHGPEDYIGCMEAPYQARALLRVLEEFRDKSAT